MRWFGKSWEAAVCETTEHADTPVGLPCARCEIQIASGDRGLLIPVLGSDPDLIRAYHLKCFLAEIGADCPDCR
jgi:hypothetical protein